MRLFHKKEKDEKVEISRSEPDMQALFRQNLKFISQTEVCVEDIDSQFVRSETRFFLTIGMADFPTGEVVVSDPLCYLAAGKMCPQLKIHIPAGSYPVEVALFRNPYVGIRMCTARLKIKETKAVYYICAESTEESAAGKCADGDVTGFPVDAGMMSFCDAKAAQEYREFLDAWEKENPGKNHYDDYFAGYFAESERNLPAYQREGGDFIEWTNPGSNHRMVMIASGFGDGFYQSYWGYDGVGDICELIVPMVNPNLFA